MAADNETGKFLLITKIVQTVLILAVLAYAEIIYVSLPRVDFAILPPGDPLLTILTGVLGFIAIAFIVLGYFWPRWFSPKQPQQERLALFNTYIMRTTMLGSIAIFGLILGILGAEDSITMLFLIVSAGALIFTFPTKKRWQSFSRDKGRS